MGNTTPPRLTHTATQFAQRISCVNSVKMPEAGSRLYVKGRHISYQRAKRNTNPNTSLLQLEGVSTTEAANFYLGKKVAYVYRAQKEVRGSKFRVINSFGLVSRECEMAEL